MADNTISNKTLSCYDYVMKVSEDVLNLARSKDDPLLNQLYLFIYINLGINVDTTGRKYEVLDSIEFFYTERRKKISQYDLDKLESMMSKLDRNSTYNIDLIAEYIKDNYSVVIRDYELCPTETSHSILDNVMAKVCPESFY